MYLLGLTGNIAAGKSAVAARLVELGATLVDADVLARAAVAPGSAGLAAIVARWGDALRRADGSLDRARLRHIVFSDPAERAALDAIVHPEVDRLRSIALAEARARGDALVVCDIPLLFEKGLADDFDATWFVDAPDETRFQRLVRDRGLTADEARAMMGAQWPPDVKRQQATRVIANHSSREALREAVDAAWRSLPIHPLPPPRPHT